MWKRKDENSVCKLFDLLVADIVPSSGIAKELNNLFHIGIILIGFLMNPWFFFNLVDKCDCFLQYTGLLQLLEVQYSLCLQTIFLRLAEENICRERPSWIP